MAEAPLAIVAGAGAFPAAVADAVRAKGREAFLVLLKGIADPTLTRYPHAWAGIGQLGAITRAARGAGATDLCFIGSLVRPSFLGVLPDLLTIKVIPELIRLYRGGDDHLLSGIAAIFEREGFHLVAAQDVAPELLMPAGALGSVQPEAADLADIERAAQAIAAFGPYDIGQAVIIGNHRIVAVEGAEGTDGLLERCLALREGGRLQWRGQRGLLVKAPKPSQDRRIDLPAIGPRTIERAAAAKLRGVAVAAGSSLVVEPHEITRLADAAGLFVYGFTGGVGHG
jgi:DUF1009 family protein